MNTNELRRGNLLIGQDVYSVTKIYDESRIGIGSGDPYIVTGNNPCLLPIPLTEEWLVKFGFVQTIIGFECSNEYFPFSIEVNSLGLAELQMEFYGGRQYRKIIKHVHQLQNIYFALTGEELTHKL